MLTKKFIEFVAIVLLCGNPIWATPKLSKDEIINMIPTSLEKDSPEEIENWRVLIDSGESIYEPLSEILFESKKHGVADGVISLFVQSRGDKTIPLGALRRYLEVNAKKVPLDRTVFSVVIAMGAMGGKGDAEALRELVDPDVFQDPDRTLLRHSLERNVEKIEKRLKNLKLDAAAHDRIESQRGSNSENGNRTTATPNAVAGPSSKLKFYWPWVAGGCLALLMVVICLKRRFGPNMES